MTNTKHVSLNDEVDRLQDRITELQEQDAELREEFAAGEHASQQNLDDDEEAPASVEDTEKYQDLNEEFRKAKVKLGAFEDALREWGGGGFQVKGLDFGELMRAKDQVQQASYDVNSQTGQVDGVPRDGFYKTLVVKLGVEDAPAGAPDNLKRIPPQVGSFLYEEINQLTTWGGEDLENLSLAEANDSNR